jgi:hypothetical protein
MEVVAVVLAAFITAELPPAPAQVQPVLVFLAVLEVAQPLG